MAKAIPSTAQRDEKREDSPREFQHVVFGLVRRLLPVDGTRFHIYVPWTQLRDEAVAGLAIDRMARENARTFCAGPA